MNVKSFTDVVRKNGWLTRVQGALIEMYKRKKNKVIQVLIRRVPGDKYIIEFPQYNFVSQVSTFAPAIESETRLCRSASVLGSIYHSLKGTDIVNHIANWNDFVVVNQYNKNVNRELAKKRLKKWQQIRVVE